MKVVNSREIPDYVGEYTSQECIDKLVELLTECANAFSATVDGDTLALTSLSVSGDSTLTGALTCNNGIIVGDGAIDFRSNTPDYAAYTTAGTGGRNDPFINIGSWDVPIEMTLASDHFVPIQVNLKNSGNVAFDVAAARLRVDTGATNALAAVGCLQLRQNIGHNVASSAILNASVNVSGACTVGSGSLLGGYFSIEGSGAITKAGDNDCTPLVAVNNNTGGGIDNVFVALQNGTGTNVDEIVKIGVTNGTASCWLKFDGTMDKGIDFSEMDPDYGDADDAFVAVGTWNDAFTVSDQVEHFVPIQVHLHSNTSVAKDIAAARLRVDTAVANTLNAVGCLQLRQSIGHNVASSAILNASVSIADAVAVQTGSLLGGYFSIEGSGAVTKAGDNDITPLVAVNNNTGGGIDNVFIALQNGTGTHVDEIVKIAVTNGTADCGLRFEGLTDQILVAGSSSSPLTCDDADTKFIQIYTDCGASSGDNRGIYNRLYLTGTGGGESLRSYTDISGTVGTAHGAHISLGFGESTTTGAVTGLGAACRVTLGLANIAYPATGTLGVIDAEIYSFGDDSDPAGNAIAMIRIGNNGNANGQADVDDDAVCFAFDGWTSADGNMVVKAGTPGAMGNATWSLRCKMPDSSLAYLNFTATPVTA